MTQRRSFRLFLVEEDNSQPLKTWSFEISSFTITTLKRTLRQIEHGIGSIVQGWGNPIEFDSMLDDISIEENNTEISILSPTESSDRVPSTDIKLIDSTETSPLSRNGFTKPAEEEENMGISRKTSGRTDTNIRVIMREEALEKAIIHTKEETSHEVGGVLLGRFVKSSQSEDVYVIVTGIVRALKAIQGITRLNFTPETWADILCYIDNEPVYGDETNWRIVGWYHSHPNFGAFFSAWDVSVHKQFRHSEHIALVVDPIRNEEAYFCWDREQKAVIGYNERHVHKKSDSELIDTLKQLGISLSSLPISEIETILTPPRDVPSINEDTRPVHAVTRSADPTAHEELTMVDPERKAIGEKVLPLSAPLQTLSPDADGMPDYRDSLNEISPKNEEVSNV